MRLGSKKVLVLITDGQPEDSPMDAATAAKDASITIITLGVGGVDEDTLLQVCFTCSREP